MKTYDKYKPSGIESLGDVPENWEVKKLKFVGDSLIGIIYSPDDVTTDEDDLLVLRSSNIQNGVLAFKDCVYVNKSVQDKYFTRKGDILICARNGSANLVGKSAFIDEQSAGFTFGAFMSVFRSTSGRFLYYFFNSAIFKAQSGLFSTSTINQLTSGTLNNMFMVFPSNIEEEIAITNYLDEKTEQIDKLIANKQRLIELLKEERTAIINQAVTKGINPDAKLKPSGIDWLGDIPEHWEVKKLKYIAQVNPNVKNFDFKRDSADKIVFLPMERVSEDGKINQKIKKQISVLSSGFTYFERNDVILAKITPCFENGKGALLDSLETDFGYGSTEFHTLRASEKVLPKFLYFLTKMEKFMTIGEAFMTGSAGQKRVPTDFLKDFFVGLPKIEEQKEIVKFIESKTNEIDSTISKVRKEIKLIKEYRTALISEVVTGKIKVVK